MDQIEEALKQFKFKHKIEMRWSDLDQIGHVNNAVYLTYLEQARVFYFDQACQWDWRVDGVILANAHLEYKRPVLYPDPAYLYVRTSKLGNKSFDMQYMLVNEYPDRKELMLTGSTTLVMYDYKTLQTFPIPDRLREKFKSYEPMPLD